QAEKTLHNCSVVAPVTGSILTRKAAEMGSNVNSLAFGAAGFLCEIADLSDMEVELDIQERDISRIKVGNSCRIMPEAYSRDERFLAQHKEGYEGIFDRRMP